MALPTVRIRIESDDFACGELLLRSVHGVEEIARLFDLAVEVVSTDLARPPQRELLGAKARLVFSVDAHDVRVLSGMIAEVTDLLSSPTGLPASSGGEATPCRAFRLRFVPVAFRLTLVETQEVFVDTSLPDLLRAKLELAGLVAGEDFELRLNGDYPVRELAVQYRESDLAFVQRSCEHVGVAFRFEESADRSKLVFFDDLAGVGPAGLVPSYRFDARGGLVVGRLERAHKLVPAVFAAQDYNYRTPLADIVAEVELPEGHAGGVVEYAPHARSLDEARTVAQLRAEVAKVAQDTLHAETGIAALVAGERFRLVEHPLLDETELLVTRIEHHYLSSDFDPSGSYRNELSAIPATVTFRPDRRTPKPRIHGFVTGVVDPSGVVSPGTPGALPRIDGEGRYWVRFHFDSGTIDRVKTSQPLRMAQSHAGAGYGSHFPLRPGVEVLVAFLDGDPDRPVILGAVPNAVTPSPVAAANAAQNRIVTASGVTVSIRDY